MISAKPKHVALSVALLSQLHCAGGATGFTKGPGSDQATAATSTERDSGENTPAGQPQMVTGAFLTCIADPTVAVAGGSGEDSSIGCDVVSHSTNKPIDLSNSSYTMKLYTDQTLKTEVAALQAQKAPAGSDYQEVATLPTSSLSQANTLALSVTAGPNSGLYLMQTTDVIQPFGTTGSDTAPDQGGSGAALTDFPISGYWQPGKALWETAKGTVWQGTVCGSNGSIPATISGNAGALNSVSTTIQAFNFPILGAVAGAIGTAQPKVDNAFNGHVSGFQPRLCFRPFNGSNYVQWDSNGCFFLRAPCYTTAAANSGLSCDPASTDSDAVYIVVKSSVPAGTTTSSLTAFAKANACN